MYVILSVTLHRVVLLAMLLLGKFNSRIVVRSGKKLSHAHHIPLRAYFWAMTGDESTVQQLHYVFLVMGTQHPPG